MDASYFMDIAIRMMILGLAAVSLDFVLGYGGLVSFGHAAFLGIGAYAVGILAYHGIDNGFIHLGVAIGASAAIAFLIGLICLRTTGLHFLMITLGFGQMFYFLGTSLDTYGGEDGMTVYGSSQFPVLDIGDTFTLYYVVFAILVGTLFFLNRVVSSRFGMVLRGAKINERRVLAVGIPVFRYRLTAFVISGVICGIAGFLLANQNLFVSPAIVHWTRSSELLIIVILGGIGTLFGPLLGAVVLLFLEAELSRYTQHWQLPLGVLLLLIVLYTKRGIFGSLFVNRQQEPNKKRWGLGLLRRRKIHA
ncbi:branched-chain amino acid ABC transporter permease [Pusillimonas sp.]|uniref:branched-chain amino acid ABC transporter permease n=1 Tax=Pusillimonas sp. TaxID=3040095 RepID=UPI0037CA064D